MQVSLERDHLDDFMMKGAFIWKAFYLGILLTCFLGPDIAQASGDNLEAAYPQVFGLRQDDINGDGVPKVTEIECAFATDRDLVSVYDLEGMPVGENWQQVTDFNDDLWIFDAGADGTAQLIIQFSQGYKSQVARIYDDVDGDGVVAYQPTTERVSISESQYPRLTVQANGSWVLPDGRPNPELRIQIDSWGERLWAFESGLLKQLLPQAPDGVIDWEYEIVDQGGDGEADYQLGRLVAFIPHYQYVFRSSLLVDQNPAPARPFPLTIFWPYLIPISMGGRNYFDTPPAIAVDWQMGAITIVGMTGYPAEQGYHMLSMSPWEKGQANPVSWENPMAYYDMAGDADEIPEMMVRAVYPMGYTASGDLPDDAIALQYIWDQDNDSRWDYQIALGGFIPPGRAVNYRDFSLQTIPYPELPTWVIDQPWDAALLTVAESGGYGGSEGFWTWLMSQGIDENGHGVSRPGLQDQYLMGYSDQAPFASYAGMPSGFRGEYCFDYFDQPRLYFSPVDRRLHLWNAQGGVYNLGAGSTIQYANLDGDTYLDQWQQQRNKEVIQQLNVYPGMVVYQGSNRVILKQTEVPPSLFETLPPRDHAEWVNLQAFLDQHGLAAVDGSDLLGMLEQIPGPELTILGASGQDFRLTADGFRVVLRLSEAYTLSGENWPALQLGPAGDYVLTYNGGFTLQTLTPPALALYFPETPTDLESGPTTYIAGKLTVQVVNLGLQDAHQVLLMLGASQAGGEITWSSSKIIQVLVGEPAFISLPWTPPEGGTWKLQVWANLLDPATPGSQAIAAEKMVTVEPAQGTTLQQEVGAFGVVFPWQAVLLLVSFLFAAGLVGGVIVRLLAQEAEAANDRADRPLGDMS